MAPGVLSTLVCVLCLILFPAVWADYCRSYVDTDGYQHQAQQCGSQYCCGNCERKYCCSNKIYREKQKNCHRSSSDHGGKSRIAMLVGSILGTIIPVMFCVCLIICCVAPCCLCYKTCRKGRNRNPQIGTNTAVVVNLPQQPLSPPAGYQPTYPGYQPVPALPEYGSLPIPTAPPPYMETNDPAHFPGAFPAGLPMVPFPGQPYAPPPHSGAPMAYNPAYVPKL
ncbi:protein shisa-5-like [Anarrhichthys ocellatus]|uniref:protein shisa-5-like n=1 Tax=Anarrhichthys ocellatus TaxID=433405 RepID=UPI0012EEA247|nr:protein shisa-5-like [Anarrhichthys ocellatus]